MQISVTTCVDNSQTYDTRVVSSIRQQKTNHDIELIPVDNTSSTWSAPSALNHGLKKASGEIVVFCHQDVIFPPNWVEKMLEQIDILEERREVWGILGTFGVSMNGGFVGNVIDPHNSSPSRGLPIKVQSLDEHCLITRKDRGLRFDEELGGFHFYGADLCLQAMANGMANFAIDACVQHMSPGNVDAEFYRMADRLSQKWHNRDCTLLVIETTCGVFRIKDGFKARLACALAKGRRSYRRHIYRLANNGAASRTSDRFIRVQKFSALEKKIGPL